MSLYQVSPGGVVNAADVDQLVQFVTGLDPNDGLSMGMTGATAANRFVGSNTQGPPTSGTWNLGDWSMDQAGTQWSCTQAGTPGTWTPDLGVIKETVLGSAAATITFSSIPANFTHLLVMTQVKSASTATSFVSDNLYVQFNGITSANYNYTDIYNIGTTSASGGFTSSQTKLGLGPVWTSYSTNDAGAGRALYVLPRYAETNYGKIISGFSYATDGGGVAALDFRGGGLIASALTGAITSLTFGLISGANIVANSFIGLYGMP